MLRSLPTCKKHKKILTFNLKFKKNPLGILSRIWNEKKTLENTTNTTTYFVEHVYRLFEKKKLATRNLKIQTKTNDGRVFFCLKQSSRCKLHRALLPDVNWTVRRLKKRTPTTRSMRNVASSARESWVRGTRSRAVPGGDRTH